MTTSTPPSPQSAKCLHDGLFDVVNQRGYLLLEGLARETIFSGVHDWISLDRFRCQSCKLTFLLSSNALIPDASGQEKVQPLSDCEYCHGPHAVSDCPEIAKLLKEKGGETCATMKVQAASQSAPVTKKQEAPTAKSTVASSSDEEVQSLPVAPTPLSSDERADIAEFYVGQMKFDPKATPETAAFLGHARTLERAKLAAEARCQELFDERKGVSKELERVCNLARERQQQIDSISTQLKAAEAERNGLRLIRQGEIEACERLEKRFPGVKWDGACDFIPAIDSLSAQLAQAKELLATMDRRLSALFWTSDDGMNQRGGDPEDADNKSMGKAWQGIRDFLSPTPPSPVLYCQTCGHGQEFKDELWQSKNPTGDCLQCHATRTFGLEKPEGKQP